LLLTISWCWYHHDLTVVCRESDESTINDHDTVDDDDDDGTTQQVYPTDCPASCTDRSFPETDAVDFRIAYLITVHDERTLNDAVYLFRAIRHVHHIILIHVDAKARHLVTSLTKQDKDTTTKDCIQKKNRTKTSLCWLEHEIQTCSCGSTVVIDSVHDVKWSHWSMNLPTLWGMTRAVHDFAGQWNVFINLSGDTYPVYTNSVLVDILSAAPYNFVTSSSCETGLIPTNVYVFPSWWHKRGHYTRNDSEPDPVFVHRVHGPAMNHVSGHPKQEDAESSFEETTMVTHFGSQWMILQADFCKWLIDALQDEKSLASQYRDYLIDSEKLMTDETFFATLLVHSKEFNSTLPPVDEHGYLLYENGTASSILDIRYERMDEHVPSAFGYYPTEQRYEVSERALEFVKSRGHPWGPYFLGVYDLANIRHSGALFVRKVSQHVDPNLLHLLPVDHVSEIPDITWPDEVQLSEKPDWERKKKQLLARQQVEEDSEYDSEDEDGSSDDDEEL